MERNLFNKRDIIILVLLLCVALSVIFFISRDSGETVEIWVDGRMYKSYALKEPFELVLDNGVYIKADGESAWFSHSDCADKVCVNTGKLSLSGEWAACLPNETVIKITKGNDVVDAVS